MLSDPQSTIKEVNFTDIPEIFEYSKFKFDPKSNITHLVINGDQMIVATAAGKLFRFNQKYSDDYTEINLKPPAYFSNNPSAKLYGLYISPVGKHCILSFINEWRPAGNFYLGKDKEMFPINQLKENLITAVGWNRYCDSDNIISNILIGDREGQLFEIEISESKRIDKNLNHFYKVESNEGGAINAVKYDRLSNDGQVFILLSTKTHLISFIKNATKNEKVFLRSIPTSSSHISKLDCYHISLTLSHFGWLTDVGILFADIHREVKSINQIHQNSHFFTFPKEWVKPLNLVLTQHHCLVAFEKWIKIIRILDDKVVYEHTFDVTLVGITKDEIDNTIWFFSKCSIFEYSVTHETRDLWKVHLDRHEFDQALNFTSSREITNQIYIEQARYYYNKREYGKSVALYALSDGTFAEVTLKLLQISDKKYLKEFFFLYLHRLDEHHDNGALVTKWLLKILVNDICEESNYAERNKLQRDLKQTLLKPSHPISVHLKKNAQEIYEIISVSGYDNILIDFAMSIGDYIHAIDFCIQKEVFYKALDCLRLYYANKNHKDPKLIYKYAPVLMRFLPNEFFNLLISLDELQIQLPLLLPSLLYRFDCMENMLFEQDKKLISYLKSFPDNELTHHFLITFYAEEPSEALTEYLKTQSGYDIGYALRICLRIHCKACVYLFAQMGMWEDAMDMALNGYNDVELAKNTAEASKNDEIKKKCWLKIAKYIAEKKGYNESPELLKECKLLKLEEILPFFSDFKMIYNFEDLPLTEYLNEIDNLKRGNKNASQRTNMIKEEIKEHSTKSLNIYYNDKCRLCKTYLLSKPFIAFPCGHKFHHECILNSNIFIKNSSVTEECLFCGDTMIESIKEPLIKKREQNNVDS